MIDIKSGFKSVDISMELFDDFIEGDNVTLENGSNFDSFVALFF